MSKDNKRPRLPAYSAALALKPQHYLIHLTAEWPVCRAISQRGTACLCCPPEAWTVYNLSALAGRETWVFWKTDPRAALVLARQAKAAAAVNLQLIELAEWIFLPL